MLGGIAYFCLPQAYAAPGLTHNHHLLVTAGTATTTIITLVVAQREPRSSVAQGEPLCDRKDSNYHHHLSGSTARTILVSSAGRILL